MQGFIRVFKNLVMRVYNETSRIPNDPIKYKIRNQSVFIFDIILDSRVRAMSRENIIDEFERLFHYFDIAQSQKWLNAESVDAIKQDYVKYLKYFLENYSLYHKKNSSKNENVQTKNLGASPATLKKNTNHDKLGNGNRRDIILDIIKKNKIITISSLYNLFPNITTRTLRRDMASLVDSGEIELIGKGKYQLKKDNSKVEISS